jgi:hypothetical protein
VARASWRRSSARMSGVVAVGASSGSSDQRRPHRHLVQASREAGRQPLDDPRWRAERNVPAPAPRPRAPHAANRAAWPSPRASESARWRGNGSPGSRPAQTGERDTARDGRSSKRSSGVVGTQRLEPTPWPSRSRALASSCRTPFGRQFRHRAASARETTCRRRPSPAPGSGRSFPAPPGQVQSSSTRSAWYPRQLPRRPLDEDPYAFPAV